MRYLLHACHGQQAMSVVEMIDVHLVAGDQTRNFYPLEALSLSALTFLCVVSYSGTPTPGQAVMEEYDARIDSTGGAVFLAVCRGKVVIIRSSTFLCAMFLLSCLVYE